MVAAAEQILRADIDGSDLVGADGDGCVPVEPQLFLAVRLGLDAAPFQRFAVDAHQRAALAFGIGEDFRRGRIGPDEEAVAAVEIFPTAVGDAARIGAVAGPGAVVLQAAIDLIRVLVVDADVIEFRNRQGLVLGPAIGPVGADPQATVITDHHVLGVGRVDPHGVVVAVRALGDGRETLAAVFAGDQRQIGLEHTLGVLRIDDQAGEIERAPDHVLAAIALGPGGAAVVGAEQCAAGAFDHGVNDLGIGGGEGHRLAAPRALGQAALALHVGPGRPAILAYVKAAARRRVRPITARAKGPALAAKIPQAGDELFGILRIEREGRAAGREVGPF